MERLAADCRRRQATPDLGHLQRRPREELLGETPCEVDVYYPRLAVERAEDLQDVPLFFAQPFAKI
ncbi:hypothetical protein CO683_35140 [Bradyrhizobium ottawaense]|nr:hypothetical protein CO683_35140 [Bradyrhizobium ottawaense]